MFLTMILAIIAILMIVVVVAAISIGGATFGILFSDVIVCVFIIGWIIKRIWKHR